MNENLHINKRSTQNRAANPPKRELTDYPAMTSRWDEKKVPADCFGAMPVTEIISNGFFAVDHQWIVLYWNHAAETIFNLDAKQMIGKNLWSKLVGVLPLEFYTAYEMAFQTNTPQHFQTYWGEMGAWFDVITFHTDNTLSVSFKSSSHTSPAKNPWFQHKSLNQLYQLVTQITNDCLWEWDLDNKKIFWIDGGHKRVFGYPVENALVPQEFWEHCIHPDDRKRLLLELKVLVDGLDNDWEVEYRFKKQDGSFAFVHERGILIRDTGNKKMRMIGATQDITGKVLLENKLVNERQLAQQEITRAVLTAHENERADIGKELHDNLNQVLAMANLYLQLGKKEGPKKEKYLEKSSGFILKVIDDIRGISKKLIIPDIRLFGLFDNIRSLLTDLDRIHKVKFTFRSAGISDEELGERLQLTLYRIIQEQANNILKHAKATLVTITLFRQENELILVISDNGDGCDLKTEKKGVGIINMKSRTELSNGSFAISSQPGKGYRVEAHFPLNMTD